MSDVDYYKRLYEKTFGAETNEVSEGVSDTTDELDYEIYLTIGGFEMVAEQLLDWVKGQRFTAGRVGGDDTPEEIRWAQSRAKDFKNLEIKVGQMAGRVMDFAAIKRLAELPGREELLAMVLAAMNAVPTSFVRVLNGTVVNLLNVLKAIETKKDEEK